MTEAASGCRSYHCERTPDSEKLHLQPASCGGHTSGPEPTRRNWPPGIFFPISQVARRIDRKDRRGGEEGYLKSEVKEKGHGCGVFKL